MESSATDMPESLPPEPVALDDDRQETDALLDAIAEENINAQASARPPVRQADEPAEPAEAPAPVEDKLTKAIIEPNADASEKQLVDDIDALLANIGGVAAEAQEPSQTAAEPDVQQDESADLGGDPDALLETAEQLAAAGGTRLAQPDQAEEPAGEPTLSATTPRELDAALAARAEKIEAGEPSRLPHSAAAENPPPPDESEAAGERAALLAASDEADEPAADAEEPEAAQSTDEAADAPARRPIGGPFGPILETLIRWIESPMERLSDDARYTVSFFAVAFLIGSVCLLLYALFFSH